MALDSSKIRIIVNLASRVADKMHDNKAQNNDNNENNKKFEKCGIKHIRYADHYTTFQKTVKFKSERFQKAGSRKKCYIQRKRVNNRARIVS